MTVAGVDSPAPTGGPPRLHGLHPCLEIRPLGQHLLEELSGFLRSQHEVLPTQQVNFGPLVLLIEKDRTDMLGAKEPRPCSVGVIQLDEVADTHGFFTPPQSKRSGKEAHPSAFARPNDLDTVVLQV